jgi:hypothetical protein
MELLLCLQLDTKIDFIFKRIKHVIHYLNIIDLLHIEGH